MRKITEITKTTDNEKIIQFDYMFNEGTASWEDCSETSDDYDNCFIIDDICNTCQTYLAWNNDYRSGTIFLVGKPQ